MTWRVETNVLTVKHFIMLVFIESQSKFRSQRRAMAAVAVVEQKKGLRALQALKVVTRMEAKGSRHHAKKRHGPGLESYAGLTWAGPSSCVVRGPKILLSD